MSKKKITEGVPVIWIGTRMEEAKPKELENFFKTLGFTVRFEEEFKDNDGYSNIIFTVLDNIDKFCMFRLQTDDMKWVDDYNSNNPNVLPKHIIEKYVQRR